MLLHLVNTDECAHSEDAPTPLEQKSEASVCAAYMTDFVLLSVCCVCAAESEGEEQKRKKSLMLCEHRLYCGKEKKKREGNNKRNNLNIYKMRR